MLDIKALSTITRKHRSGIYEGAYPQQKPITQRASRIAAQQQQQTRRMRERMTEDDEALRDDDEFTQDLTRHKQPVTNPPKRQQPQQGGGTHPLLWVACGMLLLLVGWSALLHLSGWYINTVKDPADYTQAAHRDTVVLTDAQGHITQVRAFVDTEQHLDLLILPVGSPDKAKIMRGPVLSNFTDPQHAMISVFQSSTRGTITVVAQSALIVDWLTADRQTAQWNADVTQASGSSKGGK
jgi:hypothetical protein